MLFKAKTIVTEKSKTTIKAKRLELILLLLGFLIVSAYIFSNFLFGTDTLGIIGSIVVPVLLVKDYWKELLKDTIDTDFVYKVVVKGTLDGKPANYDFRLETNSRATEYDVNNAIYRKYMSGTPEFDNEIIFK